MDVVYDLDQGRAPALHALYEATEHWSGRSADDVEHALAHTDASAGLVTGDDRLLAAARVLTDRTYYARIYEVVVAPDRRGERLGHEVVDATLAHPDLGDVHAWELGSLPELTDFYAAHGFEDVSDAITPMVKSD